MTLKTCVKYAFKANRKTMLYHLFTYWLLWPFRCLLVTIWYLGVSLFNISETKAPQKNVPHLMLPANAYPIKTDISRNFALKTLSFTKNYRSSAFHDSKSLWDLSSCPSPRSRLQLALFPLFPFVFGIPLLYHFLPRPQADSFHYLEWVCGWVPVRKSTRVCVCSANPLNVPLSLFGDGNVLNVYTHPHNHNLTNDDFSLWCFLFSSWTEDNPNIYTLLESAVQRWNRNVEVQICHWAITYRFKILTQFYSDICFRGMQATEAGLIDYWDELYTPNLTSCLNAPRKLAIKSAIAIRHIWVSVILSEYWHIHQGTQSW